MTKWILAFLTFALTMMLNGAPAAKGPATGSLTNTAVIRPSQDSGDAVAVDEGKTLPQVAPDSLPAFNQDTDGTRFILLRFQSEGASATRVHLRSVRLNEEMRLFIYGVDANGAATAVHGPYKGAGPLQSGDFWSPVVAGDQVVVEFQVDGDAPNDLPFEVDRISEADASRVADPATTTAPSTTDPIQTSKYNGLILTHAVRDGLAIYENDILLGRVEDLEPAEAVSSKNKGREGVGVSLAQSLWPGAVMPYVIDGSLPNASRVVDAVQAWNTALNGQVRLVPRTTEKNYVVFYPATVSYQCYSPVGMLGYGAQYTYLGDSCSTGNVMHEIGHELGLWHEHTRSDRNSYVSIQFQNIDPNSYYNFIQNTYNSRDLGPYDFNSIMHYSAYSFSVNGQPTILTIPAGIPIGQRTALSSGDIAAVLQLYGGVVSSQPAVQTVSVTINGNPSGAQVVVDGSTVTTPYTVQWTAGSYHTISAGDQSPASGTQYKFSWWSDGGAATHTITASSTNSTFTANFSVAYALSATSAQSGAGSVTASPSSSYYSAGSTVSLTATPASGYCFTSWNGLIAGTPATTTVSMTKPITVSANFTSCAAAPPVSTSTFTPIRVNAGGSRYWDSNGQLWEADYGYGGGSTYGVNRQIYNTSDPTLDLSERWSSSPFTYSFAVPNGTYTVHLKFAEIWFWYSGYRIFNVVINGQTVLSNFDIVAAAGGANIGIDRYFTTNVANGTVNITFVPVVSNPKISAIEITQ